MPSSFEGLAEGEAVACAKCRAIVTEEAADTLARTKFAGYNIMSIQYADPWTPERFREFYATYVCRACKPPGR